MLDLFRQYLENNFHELFDEARHLPVGSRLVSHLNEHAIFIVTFWHLVIPQQGNHLSIENDIIPGGVDLERLKILCQVVDWKMGNGSGRSIMNFEYDPINNQGRIAFTP